MIVWTVLHRPNKELCLCWNQKSQVAKCCFECRKNRIKRNCVICWKEFECKKSADKKCCSNLCAYKVRAKISSETQYKWKVVSCELCWKQKKSSPSKSIRRFCSFTCRYKQNIWPNNPKRQWWITAERQKLYSSPQRKSIVKKVRKRDDASCRRCLQRFDHTQKTFELHHKISFKNKLYRMKVDNVILVCNPCHNRIHSKRNTKKEFILVWPSSNILSFIPKK